ncbi:c-type cytochrome biogenesis protein CcmI [Commensalibacter melissae]|nr:c-type cytochrome biogenesis protein CcmI [Commensalibacter melissae]
MLWIMMILISLISLIPCFISLYQKKYPSIANNPSIAFYQLQLKELESELRQELILPEEYHQAKLEIQRRLLNSDDQSEKNNSISCDPATNGHFFILCGLICIPLTAIGLYLLNGVPALPSQPLRTRIAEQQKQNKDLAPYVKQLKEKIVTLAYNDPKRIEGYLLLGRIEAEQGQLDNAIQAWKTALDQRFDPYLAAQIAELIIQKNGQMTEESFTLFQQALQRASSDAPWRNMAEQRVMEYQKNNP